MRVTDQHRRQALRLAVPSMTEGEVGLPACRGYLAAVERLTESEGAPEARAGDAVDGFVAWADTDEGWGETVRVVVPSGEVAFSADGARDRAYELLVLADLAEGLT